MFKVHTTLENQDFFPDFRQSKLVWFEFWTNLASWLERSSPIPISIGLGNDRPIPVAIFSRTLKDCCNIRARFHG